MILTPLLTQHNKFVPDFCCNCFFSKSGEEIETFGSSVPVGDEDDFAPDAIEVTAVISAGRFFQAERQTQNITVTHVITQLMVWDDVSNVPVDRAYGHSLMLWDFEDSKHGPGIFLDRKIQGINRRPAYNPDTNFSGVTVMGRLGDDLNQKRFGIWVASMADIQQDLAYRIVWETPPGDAEMDNGNIEMVTSGLLGHDCSVYVEPWGIDPLPGEYFLKKPYAICFSLRAVFLPILNFFRDPE